MNYQTQQVGQQWLYSDLVAVRKDSVTESIVNQAISMIDTCGASEAAAYLKRHQVNMEVAIRVLSRPSQRRNTHS